MSVPVKLAVYWRVSDTAAVKRAGLFCGTEQNVLYSLNSLVNKYPLFVIDKFKLIQENQSNISLV